MPLSYKELLEQLAREDEVSILEVLGIRTQDLLDRFPDKIEQKLEKLFNDYETEVDSSED